MSTSLPLVTVIALCYNQASFLLDSLESIRRQTHKNIELVIIDDCSTDASTSLIRDWIHRHTLDCVFLAHSRNHGICSSLNEALACTRGKYVSIIATDDIWMPDKTETQVMMLESLPQDVAVVYSDAWQIDPAGNRLPGLFIESHRPFAHMPEGDIFATLVDGNFIPAVTTLIRRDCFETVGVFDENLCYEDWDMWLRIAQHYKFAYSPTISAEYRLVPTSATRTIFATQNRQRFISDYLIAQKLLHSRRLDEQRIKIVTARLINAAEALYRLHYEGRHRYLWNALRHDRRLRTWAMCASSACRIPYPRFLQIVHFYRSVRRKPLNPARSTDPVSHV